LIGEDSELVTFATMAPPIAGRLSEPLGRTGDELRLQREVYDDWLAARACGEYFGAAASDDDGELARQFRAEVIGDVDISKAEENRARPKHEAPDAERAIRQAALVESDIRRHFDRTGQQSRVVPDQGGGRPRPTRAQLEAKVAARAAALGYTADEIARKDQGTRSARHDALKDARALVVAELCDFGASYTQIGRVLGPRDKRAIFDLRTRALTLYRRPSSPSRAVD
jgi:hypothetical protein